jgi:hemoglobin
MQLRRLLILPVFAACLYASGASRAEEKKEDKKVTVDGKALDTYVYRSLAAIINIGADLYNSGNYVGCYTHYDTALNALKPLLAHRPSLQKAIDDALAKAKTAPIPERAFILREVIDQVRKDTNPNPTPVTPVTKTLWDRLGGEAGVGKVIDDFVATASKDPKVDFDRGGKYKLDVPMLKKRLVELVSAVSGGPLKYTGKSMKDAHKGMWITNEEFDAAKKDLADALKKNNVKDEDAKLVLEVVEGTRKDIVEGKKPEPEPTAKTLWDRLGGEKAVAKVVDDFFATAAKDPKVNFDRGGTFKLDEQGAIKAKMKLVTWISSQTGGPLKYEGKSMKEAHKGLGITSEEFDAAGKDLADALKKNGVKDDDAKALLDVFIKFKSDVVEPKKP